MKTFKILFAFLVSLILAGLACSVGGVEEIDPAKIVYQDNFDNTGVWEIGEYTIGDVGYTGGGAYFVEAIDQGSMLWGVASQNYSDVVLEADATQVSGPSSNNTGFGLACRLNAEGDGYYMLISGDGFYAIVKFAGGSPIELLDWTAASSIKEGNATNTVRATCIGDTMTVYANGSELGSAQDTDFTSGDIGFAATSFEVDPVRVEFDNLTVANP